MCKKELFLISTVLPLSLVGNTWAQGCDYIRVSQESSPGADDFDNNILGYIKTFQTTDTAADYYSYSSSYNASFSNLGFIGQHGLPPDRSHLFLVCCNDGLSLFIVHDRPVGHPPLDQDGGRAEMRFDLLGVPGGAKRTVEDDPGENYYIPALNASATTFRSRTAWAPCCTDGEVITGLETVTGRCSCSSLSSTPRLRSLRD